MDKHEVILEIQNLIEETKTAVLSTIDEKGKPHLRWMSPVIFDGAVDLIYAVTAPESEKIKNITGQPGVEWMFQDKTLNTVITVKGIINIVDNPSLKSNILEVISRRLQVFWKVNQNLTDFIILETIIEEAVYFKPMKGEYHYVQW